MLSRFVQFIWLTEKEAIYFLQFFITLRFKKCPLFFITVPWVYLHRVYCAPLMLHNHLSVTKYPLIYYNLTIIVFKFKNKIEDYYSFCEMLPD